MRGPLTLISGRSNPAQAQLIAESAGLELSPCDVRKFSDGELSIEIGSNVRGGDVFVLQSTSTPGNEYLMELLIIIDALKRASADRITAVIPYFGYARQDRKTKPRVPITAKLVSDLISTAGAHRVLTMDLHAGQIMGFFDVPVDNLYAMPVLIKFLKENIVSENVCVVSPDAGGVARARAYAKRLEASLAFIDKRRAVANEVSEMNVIGDVRGKFAVIVDDIVDTGRTLIKAAEALLEAGAVKVVACCTHAVLSGDAKQRIPGSALSRLIVSDTIYHPDLLETAERSDAAIIQLSVASLIGEAIRRIHHEDSVSSLFDVD